MDSHDSSSEEEDVFECGRCRETFSGLEEFMEHKNKRVCRKSKGGGSNSKEGAATQIPVKADDDQMSRNEEDATTQLAVKVDDQMTGNFGGASTQLAVKSDNNHVAGNEEGATTQHAFEADGGQMTGNIEGASTTQHAVEADDNQVAANADDLQDESTMDVSDGDNIIMAASIASGIDNLAAATANLECQKDDPVSEDLNEAPKQHEVESSAMAKAEEVKNDKDDDDDMVEKAVKKKPLPIEEDDDDDTVEISLASYNIKCTFCSSAFTSQSDLRDHFASEHRIDLEQVEKLVKDIDRAMKKKPMKKKSNVGRKRLPTDCKICNKIFSTRKNYMKHTRTKYHFVRVQKQAVSHGKRLKKCSHCPFAASNARELTDHIKKTHLVTTKDESKPKAQIQSKRSRVRPRKLQIRSFGATNLQGSDIGSCKECGKQMKAKFLPLHEKRCADKKTIAKCSECGKAVLKKALYRHQRRCLNKKHLVCPLCGHQSREKYDYSVHVYNHKTWLPAEPGDQVPKLDEHGGGGHEQGNSGGDSVQNQDGSGVGEDKETSAMQDSAQDTISTLDLSVLGLTPTAPVPGHDSNDASSELLQADSVITASGNGQQRDEGMSMNGSTSTLVDTVQGDSQKNSRLKQLKCHSCDKWFQRSDLKHHMFAVHNLVKKFKCRLENCKQAVAAVEQFLEHVKSHEGAPPFTCGCRSCLIRTSDTDKSEYITLLRKQKLKEYYQNMDYKCDKCWIKYPTAEALARHNRKETHSHPCGVCGKVQVSKRQLRMHAVIHKDERNYLCEECGASFKAKRDLTKHSMTHSDFKPFVCQECGKGFSFNNKLKRHRMTVHSNEKPFKCTTANCDKAFSRRDKLNDHARTHLYYEPFHCRFCPKGFFRKDNLKDHEVLHTKDYRFKCDRCPKGFMRPKLLAKHIAHEHSLPDHNPYHENVAEGAHHHLPDQHHEQTVPMKLTKPKKSKKHSKKTSPPSTSMMSTEAQTRETQNLSSQITYMIYQQAAGTSMAAALQQAMQSVNSGPDGQVTLPAEVLQAYHLTQQAQKETHQGFYVPPMVGAEEQILPEALHDRTEFRLA